MGFLSSVSHSSQLMEPEELVRYNNLDLQVASEVQEKVVGTSNL